MCKRNKYVEAGQGGSGCTCFNKYVGSFRFLVELRGYGIPKGGGHSGCPPLSTLHVRGLPLYPYECIWGMGDAPCFHRHIRGLPLYHSFTCMPPLVYLSMLAAAGLRRSQWPMSSFMKSDILIDKSKTTHLYRALRSLGTAELDRHASYMLLYSRASVTSRARPCDQPLCSIIPSILLTLFVITRLYPLPCTGLRLLSLLTGLQLDLLYGPAPLVYKSALLYTRSSVLISR